MAFTFRIYFSGLFVVVPDNLDAPNSCHMLLVNSLLPRKLQRKKRDSQGNETNENEILDPHFPMLIYNDAPVGAPPDAIPKRPADFRALSGDHKGRNVYLLLHDDLEIRPDGNKVSSAINVSSPGDHAPLTNMAKMSDVFPGHEHIDPILLTEELKPKADENSRVGRIVSRIRGLSGGKLYTAELSVKTVKIESGGQNFNSTFGERRISVKLAWEIECKNEMILRWSRFDFDSNSTPPPRDLRWTADAGDPVEIWIENREIDTFIGVPSSYPVARALADFEVFFELEPQPLAANTPAPPVPIPVPLSGFGVGGQAGTLHGGLCPPTLMVTS
ncbi:MAG TPA: hypothetical protein VGX68_00880 [Thermoanaerobaculia bacterium]|jgi:hypothetical protein|nr:hypothetical protein [Thermoanaerobaculia bacterium]